MVPRELPTWSFHQSVEDIDVGRYFEYDKDAFQMYSKWLDFLSEPSIRVLEIGSGSGFFTKFLLRINPTMNLTCLEPDELFVQTLKERFGDQIKILHRTIEGMALEPESFDVVISHIVVHNLLDVVDVLEEMKQVTKIGGRVVTIEPLPFGRNYYPTKDLENAFNVLDRALSFKCTKRHEAQDSELRESYNPWNRCYPQLYEQVGLQDIRCHGWTSVFTLSDTRYEISEKRKWIRMRTKWFEKERPEKESVLIEAGVEQGEIDSAYATILDYFATLEAATDEELKHIHEQEIVHRILTTGKRV
ncbi:MAG: class I SAM-dependent methyltransferase [Candidatus Thorarchaeota archaeon]